MGIALLPLLSNNYRYLLHDLPSGRTAEVFGEIRRREVDFR
jgi:hypothetical protein